MGELIEFKPRKEPLSEVAHEIFAEMKRFAYEKLLPRGISQSLVDEFLNEFEPILLSMIPPSITLLVIKDDDPNHDEHMKVASEAQKQIDDYVLGVIYKTYHREMRHFLTKKLGLKGE